MKSNYISFNKPKMLQILLALDFFILVAAVVFPAKFVQISNLIGQAISQKTSPLLLYSYIGVLFLTAAVGSTIRKLRRNTSAIADRKGSLYFSFFVVIVWGFILFEMFSKGAPPVSYLEIVYPYADYILTVGFSFAVGLVLADIAYYFIEGFVK